MSQTKRKQVAFYVTEEEFQKLEDYMVQTRNFSRAETIRALFMAALEAKTAA